MDLKDSVKDLIAEIEKKGDVKAVFGDPVKEGNVTIIPVASIAISGGGGGGEQDGDETKGMAGMMGKMKGKGFGLGYMKKARPLGYIKIMNDTVTFEPIMDWQRLIPLAIPIFGIGALLMIKMMMMHKRWHKSE